MIITTGSIRKYTLSKVSHRYIDVMENSKTDVQLVCLINTVIGSG